MAVGDVLGGRYALEALLGEGGFGRVYRARDLHEPGKVWAVKECVLPAGDPAEAEELKAFFQKEQAILSYLQHPAIAMRRECFSERGSLFLVMEYVEGENLQRLIEKQPGLIPEETAVDWALQILDVLHLLHTNKPRPIIFRDLKPANVMITESGKLKLVDFGIARYQSVDEADYMGARVAKKVQDTVCMGTPGYAAPEQYPGSGRQTDARSDIFSLGVMLHYLLTAQEPGAQRPPLPPVRQLNHEVCRELEEVIARAAHPDQQKRYPSALAMRTALAPLKRRFDERRKYDRSLVVERGPFMRDRKEDLVKVVEELCDPSWQLFRRKRKSGM